MLHKLQKWVINIILNRLAASLHSAPLPNSLKIEMLPASSFRLFIFLSSDIHWAYSEILRKKISSFPEITFHLLSHQQEMQVWFIETRQKAAKRWSNGKTVIDLLTFDPRSLQATEVTAVGWVLVMVRQKRKTMQFLKGKRAKAAVWFVMMPFGVHLHNHYFLPPFLSEVRHRSSGGNSLKSAAAFEVLIILDGQQWHFHMFLHLEASFELSFQC